MLPLWNEIRTGFNPADETQLFGPRTCVESDGFIYESTTQATISTGSEIHAIPSVIASVHSCGTLCIGVDKNLIVFTSSDSSLDCCFNIEFPSVVECFSLSQDGTFLFACIKDEGVECYSIEEKKSVFKRCLKAEDEVEISFVNVSVIEREDEHEVLIAASTGYLFRLKLRNLNNYVEKQDNEEIELLYEKLLAPAKVFTATTINDNSEIKILQFSELIKLWRNDELVDYVSLDEEIIKVQQLQQSRYIVGLTRTRNLITICPFSLQLCYLKEDMWVEDFVVLESSFGKTDPVILILEKNETEDKRKSQIHFAVFPSFEIKYSIDVAYTSYLVDIPQAVQEIFYVEGSSTKNTCIDTLNVKILAQGIPEFRLDHLLRRGLFIEAKQFAIVHGLDVEIVYKSEAVYIAQQNTSDVNTLLEILDDITDVRFIVECCSKAAAKDLHEIRQLLEYSRSRLTSLKTQTLTSDVELLLSEVNSILLRLDTYEILNQSDGTDVDDWIVFRKADLFEKCTAYLSQGNFMKAAILWNRYVSSFKKRLSPTVVVDVLQTVPQNAQMENLAPFLQFFIPLVLQICPESVDGIVDWAFEKVRYFELKKSCQPEIAVRFLEHLSSLVNMQKGSVNASFAQYSAAKTRILHMVNSLKDLQELQKKYNVHLKLDDYIQENKQKVAECILNSTTLHHLRSIIKDFLKQYFLKNNLNADYVLLHYAQNLVNYSFNYYQDSSWENTVSIISSYIQNIEDRIECILYVIKKASVPWSTAIAEMAEAGANLKHPRAADIRYEQISVKSKLILKKYGIVRPSQQQDKSKVCVSLDIVRYVIKQERDEMHSDVVQLTEASPQLKSESYLYLTNFYVEKGRQKEAFATIEMLDKDLIVQLCERMVYKIDYFLQSELFNDICSNYIAALGYIVHKYGSQLVELQDFPVQELKNMYALKCEFRLAVKLDQYVSESFRKDALRKYALSMLKSKTESYDSMKYNLERVTHLLQLPYEEGLLIAAQQACCEKELDVVRLFAGCAAERTCYLSSTSEELMCVADTLIVSEKRHEKDEDDFYLVERLTSSACCYCPPDELNKWMDEFQWSGLMCNNNDLAVTTDRRNSVGCSDVNTALLDTIYIDRPLFSQHGALHKLIGEMFHVCKTAAIQELDAETSCVFKNYYKCLREDSCEVTILKVLLNVYYKVLQCRKNEPFDVEENIILVARTLLHRILKFRKLDRTMGVALLCINNENSVRELTDASKTFSQDCVRLGALAELGVAFAEMVEYDDILAKFYQILIGCKWIKTLVKFKIPYKEAHKYYSSGCQHMFRALISVDSFSTELVEEFSSDFKLDVEDYLILYLETLILSWKPQVEVTVNLDGRKVFSVKNSEETVLRKGKETIGMIVSKERVRSCLKELYYKINYYHYEMFTCVNTLMNHTDFQNEVNDECQLLYFLKRYQRVRQPTQQEKDDWFDKYSDASEFPTIAEFRLPYLPLKDNPLRIVKTELNLKTYKSWFNVAKALRIDFETICTLAAKNSITEEFSSKLETGDNSWCLTSHHSDFLKELVACLKYCQDLEKASAVLYYATNHMPAGADQVMAAQLCYNTAVRWGEQDLLEKNAKNCIRKVQQKYLQLQAAHILHKYGLGNDTAVLNFISNPQQLIAALFKHPAIVSTSARHCPDINGAIEELAKLFRINSMSLRKEQLKELLMPHSIIEAELLDCTVTDTFMQGDTQVYKNIDEESLLRACYLLQVDVGEELVCYLVNIVMGETSDGVTVSSRLRALHCLLSTVSLPALQKLFGKDEMYIRSLTKNLTYMSKLEVLGIRYSLYSFETCNKIDLVSRVWKMCSEKTVGLTLVADLCLEYGIFELRWWDPLLKAMVNFHMMLELEEYLPQLTEHSHIMGCSGLIQAWNYIIIQPFIKAEFPLTDEQKSSCFESLVKLQTCPVINDIKFEEILDHCLRTKILHMAAAILPLLRNDQHHYVKKILANSEVTILKENLSQLQNQGILTAQQAIQILGI